MCYLAPSPTPHCVVNFAERNYLENLFFLYQGSTVGGKFNALGEKIVLKNLVTLPLSYFIKKKKTIFLFLSFYVQLI